MTSGTFTVAYILGTGHCGSTLLSMLLNGHSRMVGLSSLRKIDYLVRPEEDPALGATPDVLGTAFWQKVRARYERDTGESFDQIAVHHPSWKVFRRWDHDQIVRWAEPAAHLMAAIAAESGKDILVDSSKSWQQLYLLARSGLVRIKVLHALRDGRAVFHSYDRKYQKFAFSFGQWAKPTLAAAVMQRFFAPADWLPVKYEDLAASPEATLQRICDFLRADYEPAMLRYRRTPWVGILGNRMAQRTDETIRLDEKWKADLAPRKQLLFDALGGPLNRYFGYAFLGGRRKRSDG